MSSLDRIQELMAKHEVTAYKLAKDGVVSQANFSEWKRGKSNPSYGAIVKIAKYFSVAPEWIEGKTDIQIPAHTAYKDGKVVPIDTTATKNITLIQQMEDLNEQELNLVKALIDSIKQNRK